jgi:hypothetical protein
MTTNDDSDDPKSTLICPSCGYTEPPRDDCPICEMLRGARIIGPPLPMMVVTVASPAASMLHVPIAISFGLFAGVIVSTLAGVFGASDLVQFVFCLVSAVVGIVLGAVVIDHVTGRRRLWRKRPAGNDVGAGPRSTT